MEIQKNERGELIFRDFLDFKPNLTPREIFKKGSFGGTYWRPIFSTITNQEYSNRHLLLPEVFWNDISENFLTRKQYEKEFNFYKVKVGSTLKEWEDKEWIKAQDPYGWVEWYCHFFYGRRSKDDERQINRWKRLTGEKGRFKKMLISLIKKKNKKYNNFSISPKIRQTLQHWAYELKEHDL